MCRMAGPGLRVSPLQIEAGTPFEVHVHYTLSSLSTEQQVAGEFSPTILNCECKHKPLTTAIKR